MASEHVLESVDECIAWILAGAKPRERFQMGAEYERLVFDQSGTLIPYEGPAGIAAIFDRLIERYGWSPTFEGDKAIALTRGQGSISLEPAGQFELSGAPLRTVTALGAERDEHLAEIDAICAELGLYTAFVGMNPLSTPATVPTVPKKRYDTMRAWMPGVGSRGLDMMHLTCTVQINIDFSNEDEAMEMLRLGMLATPALIALFAASPWRAGAPTGFASTRAWIWEDVDNARCTPGDWIWQPTVRVRDYVEWALDVPMYFARHANEAGQKVYMAPERPGQTLRQMMAQGDGRAATLDDLELHLSTVFPDVRLKKFLELRACDCVPPDLLLALPALAKGLFYDPTSRAAALTLLRDGDLISLRQPLRAAAARDGLAARVGEIALGPLAIALIDIARTGLQRLDVEWGPDPEAHVALDAIDAIARGRRRPIWQDVDEALRANPSLLALRPFR